MIIAFLGMDCSVFDQLPTKMKNMLYASAAKQMVKMLSNLPEKMQVAKKEQFFTPNKKPAARALVLKKPPSSKKHSGNVLTQYTQEELSIYSTPSQYCKGLPAFAGNSDGSPLENSPLTVDDEVDCVFGNIKKKQKVSKKEDDEDKAKKEDDKDKAMMMLLPFAYKESAAEEGTDKKAEI